MLNNGGPAFPSNHCFAPDGMVRPDSDGMSLRDYFAGQALAGILAASDRYPAGVKAENCNAFVSRNAYWYADAMIASRDKENK